MDYKTLKQKRNDLVVDFHDSDLQNKDILCIEDYDKLLKFIDEYEELTCQMLQCIKQLESEDLLLGKTFTTRSKEQEVIDINSQEDRNHEDRKWLEQYLSLGE